MKKWENIKTSIQFGANAIGFIYDVPSSPRNLDQNVINSLVKKLNNQVLTVGVTRAKTLEKIIRMNRSLSTDLLQIHTNLSFENFDKLKPRVKKRIILAKKLKEDNQSRLQKEIKKHNKQFYGFLIDNSEGKGKGFNMSTMQNFLNELRDERIIVAGGLGIDNIEFIINKLNPFGVDVSSSLEKAEGIKDPTKIKQFLLKIKKINQKGE